MSENGIFYKTKKRAAEVFKAGVPYRVEAKEFESGMEDGNIVMLKKNGHIHYLPKRAEDPAYRQNYDIIGKYVRTVYGPCEVQVGDVIIRTAEGGIFAIGREVFDEWYERDTEIN